MLKISQKTFDLLTTQRFPEFQNKVLRANEIKRYVQASEYSGVVCFSSGNASAALRNVGLDVVGVGPADSLSANGWWTEAEIHRVWPDRLDATSGHLPLSLMHRIASAYKIGLERAKIGPGPYIVPTGSGETILCLSMAYPRTELVAAYNVGQGTEYCKAAPLTALVASKFKTLIVSER